MRMNLLLIVLSSICGAFVVSVADVAGDQTPLAKVELIQQAKKPDFASLPAGAPKPVLYYLENAAAPSCGLLASDGASMITPVLETEPEEAFPCCLGITDGAMFRYRGTDNFVFRYRQRDTREDVSTVHYFVRRSSGGLQPLDELNMETTPENKSIRYMAAWAKFRLVSLDNEKDAYSTSLPNSIIMEEAILNVSRNAETGTCRTVADTVSAESGIGPVSAPCGAVLASASLVSGGATYLIVLIENEKRRAGGEIFVVRGNRVRRAPDLEERLAGEIGSRNILRVKEVLRKYHRQAGR